MMASSRSMRPWLTTKVVKRRLLRSHPGSQAPCLSRFSSLFPLPKAPSSNLQHWTPSLMSHLDIMAQKIIANSRTSVVPASAFIELLREFRDVPSPDIALSLPSAQLLIFTLGRKYGQNQEVVQWRLLFQKLLKGGRAVTFMRWYLAHADRYRVSETLGSRERDLRVIPDFCRYLTMPHPKLQPLRENFLGGGGVTIQNKDRAMELLQGADQVEAFLDGVKSVVNPLIRAVEVKEIGGAAGERTKTEQTIREEVATDLLNTCEALLLMSRYADAQEILLLAQRIRASLPAKNSLPAREKTLTSIIVRSIVSNLSSLPSEVTKSLAEREGDLVSSDMVFREALVDQLCDPEALEKTIGIMQAWNWKLTGEDIQYILQWFPKHHAAESPTAFFSRLIRHDCLETDGLNAILDYLYSVSLDEAGVALQELTALLEALGSSHPLLRPVYGKGIDYYKVVDIISRSFYSKKAFMPLSEATALAEGLLSKSERMSPEVLNSLLRLYLVSRQIDQISAIIPLLPSRKVSFDVNMQEILDVYTLGGDDTLDDLRRFFYIFRAHSEPIPRYIYEKVFPAFLCQGRMAEVKVFVQEILQSRGDISPQALEKLASWYFRYDPPAGVDCLQGYLSLGHPITASMSKLLLAASLEVMDVKGAKRVLADLLRREAPIDSGQIDSLLYLHCLYQIPDEAESVAEMLQASGYKELANRALREAFAGYGLLGRRKDVARCYRRLKALGFGDSQDVWAYIIAAYGAAGKAAHAERFFLEKVEGKNVVPTLSLCRAMLECYGYANYLERAEVFLKEVAKPCLNRQEYAVLRRAFEYHKLTWEVSQKRQEKENGRILGSLATATRMTSDR